MNHAEKVLLDRLCLEKQCLQNIDDDTLVVCRMLSSDEKAVARRVQRVKIELLEDLINEIIG